MNTIYSLRPLDEGDNIFGLDALYFNIKRRWPHEQVYKNLRELGLPRHFGPGSRLLEVVDLTKLRHISLPITEALFPMLSPLFSQLTRLESLDIITTTGGPWKTSGVPTIKPLATLKKLKLRLCSDVLIDMLQHFPYFPSFAALEIVCDPKKGNATKYAFPECTTPKWPAGRSQQLSLKATDIKTTLIPTILGRGTPDYLRYTALELRFAPTSNDQTDALIEATRIISLECPLLTSLTIQTSSASRRVRRARLPETFLGPLLALRHLRVIDFSLEENLVVTKSLLENISTHFPQLECCVLHSSYHKENRSGTSELGANSPISIIDIARFAARCRYLRTVGLTAREVAKCLDELSMEEYTSTNLVRLNVGRTPVEDPRSTAGFIQRAFPFLDRLTWEDEVGMPWEDIDAWNIIHEILFS